LQRETALIEQGLQPHLGALAQLPLGGAAGAGYFRGVDIGDADLAALEPDGVAVDHARVAFGAKADAETGAIRIDDDCGGCRCRSAAQEDCQKQRDAQGGGDDDEGGPADVVHRLENSGKMLKEAKLQHWAGGMSGPQSASAGPAA
jgi:hypothetical protein